jgi:hypothetical protein
MLASVSTDTTLLANSLDNWLSAWPEWEPDALPPAAVVERLEESCHVAEVLSHPPMAACVQRALERLMVEESDQQALITVTQLRYLCCKAIARFIGSAVHKTVSRSSSSARSLPSTAAASRRQPVFNG